MASCKLQVPVMDVKNRAEFETLVYCNRKPAVLRGFDLGAAPQLWTASYLRDACGDIPVKVHVSPTNKMNFISKNFAYKYAQCIKFRHKQRFNFYRTLPFGQFVTRASKVRQDEFFFEAVGQGL